MDYLSPALFHAVPPPAPPSQGSTEATHAPAHAPLLLVLCLFLLATPAAGAQPANAAPPPTSQRLIPQGVLEAEAVEERDLGANEAHAWTLTAQAGDYVEVELHRSGVEAEAEVYDPAGAGQLSFTNDVSYLGTSTLRWAVEAGGEWEVHVAAARPGLSGHYGIRLVTIRPATAADRTVLEALGKRESAAGLWEGGRYDEAEALQREALRLLQETPGIDSLHIADAHSATADIYYYWGRYGAAATHMEEALAIYEALYGPEGGLTSLNNLAVIYNFGARYEDSERAFRRTLELREQVLGPRHPRVAITIDNLTSLYVNLGRYAEAEALARRCLDIKEEAWGEDHYYLRWPLSYLATIYQMQGRDEEAETAARRALDVTVRARGEEDYLTAFDLLKLAAVLLDQGRTDEALPLFRRALATAEAVRGANHPKVASYLSDLGAAHRQQGDAEEAMRLFERALAMWREAHGSDHPKTALAQLRVAETYEILENPEAAAQAVEEAIAVLESSRGYPSQLVAAYALRARLRRGADDHRGALLDLEEALYAIEVLRPQVGGGEEARAAFFGGYGGLFDTMVAWQIEAGDTEAAFEWAERARARAFLDQLAAGQVDLRASIPADVREALEDRETDARARLAEFQKRITFTRSREDLPEDERLAMIAALADSLRTADRDYAAAYAEVKAASPLWRSYVTSGGEPVRLTESQRSLVPSEGLLLLYQLGEEVGHLFVIPPGRDEVDVVELVVPEGAAAVLSVEEGPLTEAKLHAALAGEAQRDGLVTGLSSRGTERGTEVEGGASEEALRALWQVLLPAPVWERVTAASEVVVIPDGPLHALPFEALVVEPGTPSAAVRYWLDVGPAVRYAPSVTALYNIGRRPAPRVVARAGVPRVVSLSSVIYDPADVLAQLEGAPGDGGDLFAASDRPRTRDAYVRAGGNLAPLPGTALETAAIREAYGPDSVSAVVALQGIEATESALRAVLPGKQFVHLATHGLVEANRSSLFAALALTPSVDMTSDLSTDGFLQLHEVYGLDLSEAELAVLSACDTAVGEAVAGEGVFALSRGFLAAGARRVVASQWAVDDASTATLIGAFFEAVVAAEQKGQPVNYASALFEAKRAVRARTEWSAPYYWAPFTLAGM